MRELLCINCPIGCRLTVEEGPDHELAVTGNRCPKGEAYALQEIRAPKRVVTALMKIEGFDQPMSVKTSQAVPKEKIFPCVEALRQTQLKPPIHCGDVLIENLCDTGADVMATRDFPDH